MFGAVVERRVGRKGKKRNKQKKTRFRISGERVIHPILLVARFRDRSIDPHHARTRVRFRARAPKQTKNKNKNKIMRPSSVPPVPKILVREA